MVQIINTPFIPLDSLFHSPQPPPRVIPPFTLTLAFLHSPATATATPAITATTTRQFLTAHPRRQASPQPLPSPYNPRCLPSTTALRNPNTLPAPAHLQIALSQRFRNRVSPPPTHSIPSNHAVTVGLQRTFFTVQEPLQHLRMNLESYRFTLDIPHSM